MAKSRKITLTHDELLRCIELIEKLTGVVRKAVESRPSEAYTVDVRDDEDPGRPPVAGLGGLGCKPEGPDEPAPRPAPKPRVPRAPKKPAAPTRRRRG